MTGPFRRKNRARRRLHGLMLELFSADELRVWIGQQYGASLQNKLHQNTSHEEGVWNALNVIERIEGLDDGFFSALRQARGRRAGQIDEAQDQWIQAVSEVQAHIRVEESEWKDLRRVAVQSMIWLAGIAILVSAMFVIVGRQMDAVVQQMDAVVQQKVDKALASPARIGGDTTQGRFQVPSSSSSWIKTSIVVPSSSYVVMHVSSAIHIAAARLVEAAQEDTRPSIAWSGPSGVKAQDAGDCIREALRFCRAAPLGSPLAVLAGDSNSTPDAADLPTDNILMADIHYLDQDVGEVLYFKNDSKQALRLWLMVNDVLLDSGSEDYYLADCKEGWRQNTKFNPKCATMPATCEDKIKDPKSKLRTDPAACKTPPGEIEKGGLCERLRRWETIVDTMYWTVWWDDNIGQFDISVVVLAEEPQFIEGGPMPREAGRCESPIPLPASGR